MKATQKKAIENIVNKLATTDFNTSLGMRYRKVIDDLLTVLYEQREHGPYAMVLKAYRDAIMRVPV